MCQRSASPCAKPMGKCLLGQEGQLALSVAHNSHSGKPRWFWVPIYPPNVLGVALLLGPMGLLPC